MQMNYAYLGISQPTFSCPITWAKSHEIASSLLRWSLRLEDLSSYLVLMFSYFTEKSVHRHENIDNAPLFGAGVLGFTVAA